MESRKRGVALLKLLLLYLSGATVKEKGFNAQTAEALNSLWASCVAGWGHLWWSCTGTMLQTHARTLQNWPGEDTTTTPGFTGSLKTSWSRVEILQEQVSAS